MRILQLLSSTGFHGAESMTAELVKKVHSLGHIVDVAVLDNWGTGNAEIFDHVAGHVDAVHRMPCDRQFDWRTVGALRRVMIERRIDVVHSHKYKTTFYAAALRPLCRFGLVTTYHNWLTHSRALRFYARVDKFLARFNDYSVGVSTAVVDGLRGHVPAAKLVQIDNGIDTEVFCPAAPDAAMRASLCADVAQPLVGFVGRLSDEKGLPDLLAALARPEIAHVQAVIVGDGDARAALTAQLQALGMGDRVRLVGHRRDTPNIYRALDMLVLPSYTEAFPMVLLEAMATGRPVVATAVGEVERMVRHGQTGLVVPPRRPDALSQAIAQVLEQRSRGAAWGDAARLDVQVRFSSEAMARRYLEIYMKSCQG